MNHSQSLSLPPFVTYEEAARLSSTSVSTIRRMVQRQQLEVVYFEHSPRIVVASLFTPRGKRTSKEP